MGFFSFILGLREIYRPYYEKKKGNCILKTTAFQGLKKCRNWRASKSNTSLFIF